MPHKCHEVSIWLRIVVALALSTVILGGILAVSASDDVIAKPKVLYTV